MSDNRGTATLYVDGIENVSLVNGMVRIEFFRVKAIRGESDKIAREDAETLVMTPQVFLNLAGTLDRTIGQMEKTGIVTRSPAPEAPKEKGKKKG